MGKNGSSKPADTILTLEEALQRFKRKREAGAGNRVETASDANVRYADFSATVRRQSKATATSELKAPDDSASASAQRDEANAGMPASEDLVAVIEGIPRTLEQLEQIAAADKAYEEDFPENGREDAELEDGAQVGRTVEMALANRYALRRDYAFTAIGAALMVLAAFLIMRVPIVGNQSKMVAQTIMTPALKASSPTLADDLITTLVITPNTDFQLAAAHDVQPDELEARIKDALKLRAFPDIGVSVSKTGDAYLAGDVYSLDEARTIQRIVRRVRGVNRVHFLHPDVRPAYGPAYFGVTTASWTPAIWGAKVQTVTIGSPADKAGIKPGDVISEFDGKTVPDAKAFDNILASYSPGQRVQFRAWHDGQPEYLLARLGEETTVASR
jgi:PDZ domain/BON domain